MQLLGLHCLVQRWVEQLHFRPTLHLVTYNAEMKAYA